MDRKSGIKQRREERIQRLIEMRTPSTPAADRHWTGRIVEPPGDMELPQSAEQDPELVWKKERERMHSAFREEHGPSFFVSLRRRLMISCILFGAVWAMFRWDIPYTAESRLFIADTLNRDMDMTAAAEWYKAHFGGAPSFLPAFGEEETGSKQVNASGPPAAPLTGTVVQSFAVSLKGIEIVPDRDGTKPVEVKSIEAGRVLEVTHHPQNGTTVVIRHTGGLTAVYGKVTGTQLQVDDWVQKGEAIGLIAVRESEEPATLYFAVKQDDRYIDPAEVVSFD
ncbi:M23 family metallopeptidase [Paenibacillus sp. P96]|uniref:M23 family metallopeptidase n=1 Tax=Paenibacillus zeirhizosphaerae TaxID=2987519 RepID=A0ABT9FLP6_9BACL|nr:M23 family metallopeptidase [Paenibacillus sp. P96]MDP4095659.1 M23 family metallopeptidase [Paenibacillus sp. P96]